MKYAVFFLALLAMPPLGVALSFNRRWMKYAIWAMLMASLGLNFPAGVICQRLPSSAVWWLLMTILFESLVLTYSD